MRYAHKHLASFVVTLLLCVAALHPACADFSGLVAFGDSLTDRGNTIGVTGHNDHDAEITGYDNNYYNAAYNSYGIKAEGRWSSGPTWIEYLYGNLLAGHIGADPVDLGANVGMDSNGDPIHNNPGRNFAWGGSTTGDGVGLGWVNLGTQVANYIALSGDPEQPAISTALYSIWSGGNDAINWVQTGSTTLVDPVTMTLEEATSFSAANIESALTALYQNGGRYFLVPNLPDLGKKPNYINTENEAKATSFVDAFNAKLADIVLTLETTYSDISITYFDAHSQFNLLLSDPAYYGFDPTQAAIPAYVYTGGDPTSTIVDDPTIHVFWDNTHPTTQVHQLLGNYAYQAVVPEPGTIALFMIGGLILGFAHFGRKKGCRPAGH